MASGSAKIECDSQITQNDPAMPQLTYCDSSGMRVTWMGTTWSAKIATNRMARPLKSIHASAYAARSASEIGMITAGSVMTTEFTKYVIRLVDDPKRASW